MSTEYKTKWNLNLIIAKETLENPSKYRNLVKIETTKFIKKWKQRDDYLKDPKALKEALDEFNTWVGEIGTYDKEMYYIWLASSLDQNDPKIKGAMNKLHELSLELFNDIQFFELNVSKIEENFQQKMLKSKLLSDYHHYLEGLFRSGKHTLSEKEERIMNLKAKVSGTNWAKMLSGMLVKQERKILNRKNKKESKNFSEIMDLLSDKDKKVRDAAAKALNEILKEHKEVAENEINSILENKKVNDNIRGYSRPEEARFISGDVEAEVVDTLVKTVKKYFKISQNFYKLKAKLLGFKKLQYHERNVEYGNVEFKYKFEEAYNLVKEVYYNLDEEFGRRFEQLFSNGQVDVFPKKNKSGGAFCAYNNIQSSPTFVLLNYAEDINNISTIAHEFGHAMHFELTRDKQNALNFDFPMSTAETASTFFEDFVFERITKELKGKEKLILMISKLNNDVSTIIRQIAAFIFEQELHSRFREMGYLSVDDIGNIFTKNMKAYMGPYVEQSPGSESWWIYWSHFRNPFYVYSYSFGALISKSLQNLVKTDKKNISMVKEFLSAGSSMSPKDLFRKMNIDITDSKFWEKGLKEMESKLKEAEKLATELKVIK